jgi:hypothetical protein
MLAVLRRVYVPDALVLSGLIVSFFQGYMRDHYGGILSYGLADALFGLAFFLVVLESGLGTFFADTPMTRPLLILLLGSLPFVFGPDNHVLEGLFGYRAWNFYNLLFFYAYFRIKDEKQIRWVSRLLMGMGLVVAAYGIYQFLQGPAQYLGGSAGTLARHEYSVYYAPGGEGKISGLIFRPYSTLNSAGALGGTLAGLIILGISLLVEEGRKGLLRRVGILSTMGIMGICMFLTGSRGAVVVFVVGTLALLIIQRHIAPLLIVAVVATAGVSVVNMMTEGAVLQRLETLDPTSTAASYESYVPRFINGTWGGNIYLWQYGRPWGLGLGSTGVGVPTLPQAAAWGFRGQVTDSEFSRASVEMGYIGYAFFLYFMGTMIVSTIRAAVHLRESRFRRTGAAVAALVLGYLPITVIGNPLYGPPTSLLIWLSLGTLLKLDRLAADEGTPGSVHAVPAPGVPNDLP